MAGLAAAVVADDSVVFLPVDSPMVVTLSAAVLTTAVMDVASVMPRVEGSVTRCSSEDSTRLVLGTGSISRVSYFRLLEPK